MTFTQIIELDGVDDEQALHDHVAAWDTDQAGVAPGYLGARVLADSNRAGHYQIVVDFTSEEEATANNDRPETARWATRTRELAGSDPTHHNLREVCTTYR